MDIKKIFLVIALVTAVSSEIIDQLVVKNVVHEALTEVLDEFKTSSLKCAKHLLYALDIKNIKQGWPLRMIDASSKIPSGLLSGNIADLGAFDQCLAIEQELENDIIKGKYCKAAIPLKSLKDFVSYTENDYLESRGAIAIAEGIPALFLAICVPNSCTPEALNKFLQSPAAGLAKALSISFMNCQTNDSEPLTAGDWAVLVFLIFIFVIIILSTAYDVYIHSNGKEPAHLILIAFSLFTNGQKLLTVTRNPNQLTCLHGIRFISMMWVILGHTYNTAMFSPSINALDIMTWMKKYTSMYILGATVSVDTFFLLGGLLMSYVYLSAKEKGIKFNIIMYYIHRYIRLTPALAVAVVLHITLLRYLGSGPYWPETMQYLEINCSEYWWSSLLYVQNYVNKVHMCIGQTWYLSVDFQLFILSPLALIPLGKWPHYTIPVLGLLICVSMVIPFVIAYNYEIPGLITEAYTNPEFNNTYYMNTYVRFGPVVVGLVLGYYIYSRKQNLKLNSREFVYSPKCWNTFWILTEGKGAPYLLCAGNAYVFIDLSRYLEDDQLFLKLPGMYITLFKNIIFKAGGWIISMVTLFLIVFEANNMYSHDYDRIESSIYVGVHRVVWSLALCWIIYACIIGHGGIVNLFLSLPIFQILSRLTYSMYLIHLSLQTMKIGYLRVPVYFANFMNMYNFWGDFIFTIILSTIWTLAFESPMITIEKIMFSRK